MFHAMTVTSPLTHGPEVTRRQKLLDKNVFKQDFLQGPVDGQFGTATARACIRAKYYLGYKTKDQTPVYGEFLDGFLRGTKKLPAAQEKVRRQRLKTPAKPLNAKALERAVKDIGMKEKPPNSNLSAISRLWGIRGPWCAMGVSEWYLSAGSKAFMLHRDYAYVPFMLAAAEHGGHGLFIVAPLFAQPGDILCFDWDGDNIPDHTGLFKNWLEPGRTFETVEANTAVGNDSNGGEVMQRDRAIHQLATYHRAPAVIRVGR